MSSFAPPPYSHPAATPPAGHRIPTTTSDQFPFQLAGETGFTDLGGEPVFVGSALMGTKSVQPCKIAPHLTPAARVPYGGQELEHSGRYDILPVTSDMEWVYASHGELPKGRRPVEGGYEESGEHLFHALVEIPGHPGVHVPGKTAPHLRAAHVAWGGSELVVSESYQVLVWRN